MSFVRIGSAAMPISKNPSIRVPLSPIINYKNNQQILSHLNWMLKKDSLNQDIFLISSPGPFKLRLALTYLALTNKEYEFVSIHPDTSGEGDLKQKREIVTNQGSQTLKWVDGSCVKAVCLGRTLIIDGIEKSERNVLPILNNLLENREMALEDGRHIIGWQKYDKLLQSHSQIELDRLGILRANESFRVIALGIPVPFYKGNPLDPPFRSRFQVRWVDTPTSFPLLEYAIDKDIASPNNENCDTELIRNIQNVNSSIKISNHVNSNSSIKLLPDLPQNALENIVQLLKLFPLESHCFERVWPKSFLPKVFDESQFAVFNNLLNNFNLPKFKKTHKSKGDFSQRTSYSFIEINKTLKSAIFEDQNKKTTSIQIELGSLILSPSTQSNFHLSNRCQDILTRMLQSHALRNNILLVGSKSTSKSITINHFASILGYKICSIYLYKDVSSRDLLQRRMTRADGSTYWQDSLLVRAAKGGDLAVLEGIEWVNGEVLGALSRLFHDREIVLPDNSILVNENSFKDMELKSGLNESELNENGYFKILSNFRIIATAILDKKSKTELPWLSDEVGTMFDFHFVDDLSDTEEFDILKASISCSQEIFDKTMLFSQNFRHFSNTQDQHKKILVNCLTTRQLKLILSKASFPESDLHAIFKSTFLYPFLPQTARNIIEDILSQSGIKPNKNLMIDKYKIQQRETETQFSDVIVPRFIPEPEDVEAKTLVPHSENEFYENPLHNLVLRDIALDFKLGSNLLIIGNQGVGKNKIVDRFLELISYPREYIQLHRDSTLSSLLVQPSVDHGRYNDSPLIKAIKNGRVCIIDEADKAPVYITSILKSLVETGEMDMFDGRRIKRRDEESGKLEDQKDVVYMHPKFRLILLANRPGFPFLGNDFISSIGESFACYPIENPDEKSEVSLLTQLAPQVDATLISNLVRSFGELRKAFDNGLVNYPYSLRELINIVRHIDQFPDDDIEQVLRNVFDFDVHKSNFQSILFESFTRHGISISKDSLSMTLMNSTLEREMLAVSYSEKIPPKVGSPKHGKIDSKNDPHVGGNQWAGGSGGSDTAGLGGRGGPYRLDSGNKIHQLPDSQKNDISPAALKAARDIGKIALQKRLAEINMNQNEWELYHRLQKNILQTRQQLRLILEDGVYAKDNERVWLRNQTEGELDDSKLIDGLTGEHSIFKKRGTREESNFRFNQFEKPKIRIKFVFDVSGSMYRFNSFDQRLDKSLETAILVMESFEGLEDRFVYDIVGHSGDSNCIEFVKANSPKKNEMERLQVVLQMYAHSQYCWSGDNTVQATQKAIQDILKDEADKYFVFVLSDANLKRYGIDPLDFCKILEKEERVSTSVLFLGSLGEEAKSLTRVLPSSFIASNTELIPLFMKEILEANI